MKIFSIEYRPSAQRDIESIADYIFERTGSAVTALHYVRRLRDRCRKICSAPFACIARNDLGDGIRMAVFERSVVILYVVEKKCVCITNIFSGGKDYEALLRMKDERN
ncbi:type II toxin-antitoxin system RelE/ParE family toxin [Pararhizobium sp. O133]|uniref:type II toxin-antitoxin system RelE/ParE family toxin n=1 Tax=Pararhizobium sp. O133 TaxID=3449278 RepID=UPI003F684103